MKFYGNNITTILPEYTIITPKYYYDTDEKYYNRNIENLKNNTFKKYTGEISKQSKIKLKYAISLLIYKSKWKTVLNPTTQKYYKFKINFITLTLPSPQNNISDKEIKNKYLNNFLIQLKKKYGVIDYVWKAETQENGNIHFHITTNQYIEHEKIKNLWNKILYPSGLIEEYYKKHNNRNPNSTDIHSVKNIQHIQSYLIKYFTKNENNRRKIDGKIWDCSNTLNYCNRFIVDNSDNNTEISNFIIENYSNYAIQKDYCTIYKITFNDLLKSGNTNIITKFNKWMEEISK